MKVNFSDSFFKSLEKINNKSTIIYKIYDGVRYDIPNFFRNIWLFRKALWNFRWWDYRYILEMMYTSLFIMEKNFSKRGNEISYSRDKKINKMKRVLEILKNKIDNNYIERSELVHGEIVYQPFEWKKSEKNEKAYELIDNDTKEEKEFKNKVYDYADKIEKEEWQEIWEILKGRNFKEYEKWFEENKHNYTQEQIDECHPIYDFTDGVGLDSWWD